MKMADGTATKITVPRASVAADLRYTAISNKVDNCLKFSAECTPTGTKFFAPVVGSSLVKDQQVCFVLDGTNKPVVNPISFDVPLTGNWFGSGGDKDACKTAATVSDR